MRNSPNSEALAQATSYRGQTTAVKITGMRMTPNGEFDLVPRLWADRGRSRGWARDVATGRCSILPHRLISVQPTRGSRRRESLQEILANEVADEARGFGENQQLRQRRAEGVGSVVAQLDGVLGRVRLSFGLEARWKSDAWFKSVLESREQWMSGRSAAW